jgi:hypothetical protein
MHRVSRKLSITTAVAIAALALSAVALAAKPVKGATYKGHYGTSNVVRFKVSANGKTVTKMHFATFPPNKCGSGGPEPKQSSKPATITNGKFKVRLTYSYASSGGKSYTYTVTGKFLKHRMEKGVFINETTLKQCRGKFPYTTTAQ